VVQSSAIAVLLVKFWSSSLKLNISSLVYRLILTSISACMIDYPKEDALGVM